MTASAAAHEAHLDAEQLAGDLAEERAQRRAEYVLDRWHDLAELGAAGLPLDPPPSPEDEETFPPDPEGAAA